ncbi:MAG: hypothetical protein IT463_08920, partial [Planctomycetes bacterium]|nr:hypothetical protein [Planctomycetota bacterium]
KVVGRVDDVAGNLATARLEPVHAPLLRQGSRFWVQEAAGDDLLCFDSPPDAGAPALPKASFIAQAARPELAPSEMPLPSPRRLETRPMWLCEVRAVTTLREGQEDVREVSRKSAGAVLQRRTAGELLVLAPAWLLAHDGELVAQRARLELAGGALHSLVLLERDADLAVLLARGTSYDGPVVLPLSESLPPNHDLLLAGFDNTGWPAGWDGELRFQGVISEGFAALAGERLAGFVLPPVGRTMGGQWVSSVNAGPLLAQAGKKLE